ncbi:AB hydrolase-1 domain-containing protein [Haematococcus lacustris]|uniref:AB hydrolase-1 domain-containing protein n=1 Tax=Haematococcus lacustris TaxID=44745 RepID=A0A6A0A6C4_HAELA|nr:AB hydrolase-1 domain-containing protein [Haematococcus lacustris]
MHMGIFGRPVMLLGEMVFPWMFEDFAGLRPYQEAAQLLASKADWGRLYAPEVLAHNKVPDPAGHHPGHEAALSAAVMDK